MPDPDYKALCAELLAALEIQLDELRFNDRLCARARAVLAQPVAPTNEELDELFASIDEGASALNWRTYARAVLAKWGTPANNTREESFVADLITPPDDLVRDWARFQNHEDPEALWRRIATLAARWGSNQELEACVNWLDDTDCEDPQEVAQRLRAARRPKPPSLKEQALAALIAIATGANDIREQHQDFDTIRAALEALPND